jgi:hypothetical protein
MTSVISIKAMTSRQQEDLLHVLTRLNHLTAHLADISTGVSDNEPYSREDDIAAQELYIKACDLVGEGQQLLQRFNPEAVVPESIGYTRAAKWMPDMPLRCCLGCAPHGNSHGMSEEDVRAGQSPFYDETLG